VEHLEQISLLRFDTQYLAHPAEFEKEGKQIQKALETLGIKVINPFKEEREEFKKTDDWKPEHWWMESHSPEEAKHIVERDLAWIRKSDAIFAFLPEPSGYGTTMEIFYAAKLLEKPVFIYTSKKYRFHPWLMYFGQVFTDIEFALEVLKLRKKVEGYAFRIALGGKMGSGKSSDADFLAKSFQFKQYGFSTKLKEIASDLFDMEVKDRVLLQMLGTRVREIETDAWANYVMKQINAEAPLRIVIDDLRYINESEILRENGFTLIKLDAPVSVRKKRGIVGFNEETATHPSEVELDAIDFDYTIDSSCTVDESYKKIMEILAEVAEK